MTSGIVFVLHGPADETFAGQLAAALTPLPALPVQAAPGVHFGGGAVCVVLWTQELCTPAMSQAVLAAVAESSASVVLCKGAVPPEALRARAVACLPARAEAGADAEQVRGVIAAMDQAAEAAAQRVTPTIGRASGAVRGGKQNLATRSAYGLLVTLAVAGAAAPMISERAAATNVPPNGATPSSDTNSATVVAAPAPADAVSVVEASAIAQSPQTPAFDQWVRSATGDTASLLVQTAAFVAEPPAPMFDPKLALSEMLSAHSAGASAAKPGAALLASGQKPVHLADDGDAGASPGE